MVCNVNTKLQVVEILLHLIGYSSSIVTATLVHVLLLREEIERTIIWSSENQPRLLGKCITRSVSRRQQNIVKVHRYQP